MLTLENITKTYIMGQESVQVLKGISLKINKGDFVAIMGPSGSGKSTLMNIIGMLDVPTSGVYMLDGVSVENLTADDQSQFRGQKVGFIFQGYNLIPRMSALDQVALPLSYQGVARQIRYERATIALERVGLKEKMNNKPNELSGGQQQRVAIARALIVNPSIILADEPTGALDTKTGDEVMQIITDLHKEGKTIILITHEPDIAKYAQKIIHIKDGNILI